MTYILGISAFYHDSAAALIKDGDILSAVQEERFTRIRHDLSFPYNSIFFCLNDNNLEFKDIDIVVFYDKPLLKFKRILSNCIKYAPNSFELFREAFPLWTSDKIFLKKKIKQNLTKLFNLKNENFPEIMFTEHHQSHAASAFYPSPFESASIICFDGVGEYATTSVWRGQSNKLEEDWQINFPHSLGLLYSAFTYYTGFKVNSGEYKLMGLAPYGEPIYFQKIMDNLIEVKNDGSYKLNLKYFNFHQGLEMTNNKFHDLFEKSPRTPEAEISQHTMNVASSIQAAIEEVVIKIAKSVLMDHGSKNLCLAGGVALNCVANGKILRESGFENIWIQPAAGDAGGSLGAALEVAYKYKKIDRNLNSNDSMKGSYLGPNYIDEDIREFLDSIDANYLELDDKSLFNMIANKINEGNVIGLFQGKMEFGPRALGNRSIIGDPRNPDLQSTMNLKIKFRESFRPFAPAILEEYTDDYFDNIVKSPYMLLTDQVKELHRKNKNKVNNLFGIDKLKNINTTIPAVTHVDYSSRVQTVSKKTNPRFHKIISAFNDISKCPMVINTSFNVRGEPIVNSPEEAYRCFMRSNMDFLIIENFLLNKSNQKNNINDNSWKEEYVLD